MSNGANVLERSVLQAGKVFIRSGEDNSRAYVIQTGEVRGFIMRDGKKVEVARYGPGTIIGELGLMLDDPSTLSYEALESATVVTVTRQDFQKRLIRADKSITTILEHAVKKIQDSDKKLTERAIERSKMDETALLLVQGLLSGFSDEKKALYEDAVLPHLNAMMKDIKRIKEDKNKKKKNQQD